MKSYKTLVSALLGAWFALALAASALRFFENDSNRIGFEVAFAALAPVVLFTVWFSSSRDFRKFVLSLNPGVLTAIQSWRILGLVFVLMEARGSLPALFALPAGYGDMAIGATAVLAAWKLAGPRRRGGFILWHALGAADLVMAVSLGVAARALDSAAPSMLPMTVLPLSLVPAFLVPLFLIVHAVCIIQARTWSARPGETGRSAAPRLSPGVSI
jgi:hypothetical protein